MNEIGTYTINFCNNVNGSAVEVIGNIHDNPELLESEDGECTAKYVKPIGNALQRTKPF